MSGQRKWDLSAGAALLLVVVLLLLGAVGYGISRYSRWKQAERQAQIQGRLNYAAASGFAAEVRTLLQQGASASGLSREGYSPLHGVVMLGKTDMARLLLDAGADPNAHAPGTSTPLYEAVSGSHMDERLGLTRLLLEAGADPNGRSPELVQLSAGPAEFKVRDQTALMRAMIGRSDGAVRLLLKHGADPNLTDSEGKTALHWWVLFRRSDRPALALGSLLVRKGADPHLADRSGKTPLDYARELGDARLRETLTKAAAIRDRKMASPAGKPRRNKTPDRPR